LIGLFSWSSHSGPLKLLMKFVAKGAFRSTIRQDTKARAAYKARRMADIEAERLAQRLKDADVPNLIDALAQIRTVAEDSEGVAESAVEALKVGAIELEHDNEIIEGISNDAARLAAINARDRTVGYMLLVYRNFVAGAVKAGNELAGLGAETWKEFRKDAPKQFSSAAIATAIAALVGALLGPIAAAGAFAASFKPLQQRAKRTVDRLVAAARKNRSEVKEKN
jgi:hypothetical protein